MTSVGKQSEVARWFMIGNTSGQTPSKNLRISGSVLWHYWTIEAFRDADGQIINNNNCWATGYARCPHVQSQFDLYLRSLLAELQYASYSAFEPEKLRVTNREHDPDLGWCLNYEYDGRRYKEADSTLFVVDDTDTPTPKWHCRWGNSAPKTHAQYQKSLRQSAAAIKAADTKKHTMLKEIMPLETLTRAGFRLKYVDNKAWWRSVDWDEKSGIISIRRNSDVRLVGRSFEPADVKVQLLRSADTMPPLTGSTFFKLVAVQKWLSDYSAREVYLCGINKQGKAWVQRLPTLPYAYAGIEACKRGLARY